MLFFAFGREKSAPSVSDKMNTVSAISVESKSMVKEVKNRKYFSDEREKYGKSIEIVECYNSTISFAILQNANKIPVYVVEWLAESIQSGTTIETSALYDSIEHSLPYFCETEQEYKKLMNHESPLTGFSEEFLFNIVVLSLFT